MMRTSKETISDVLYTLKVAALIILELKKGGGGGEMGASGAPPVSGGQKKSVVWIGLIYLTCFIPTAI